MFLVPDVRPRPPQRFHLRPQHLFILARAGVRLDKSVDARPTRSSNSVAHVPEGFEATTGRPDPKGKASRGDPPEIRHRSDRLGKSIPRVLDTSEDRFCRIRDQKYPQNLAGDSGA